MTTFVPAFQVELDALNPGQFFACCGVLELADRLWPGAEGRFTQRAFEVGCPGTLRELLQAMVDADVAEILEIPIDDAGEETIVVKPLIAPLKLTLNKKKSTVIQLHAWMRMEVEKGEVVAVANPPWNFWSGQQTSFRIWRDLCAALKEQLPKIPDSELARLFEKRLLLTGRFGFDPGAAWNALDVGFSPNEQGIEVSSSAAVEMLAAVGIQRFRPRADKRNRDRFTYATWKTPLAPQVAAAATAGALDSVILQRYLGRVVSRGSYAALGRSALYSGGDE